MNCYATYNGNKVFYKKTGKGIPLYLIHGFCADHRIWDELARKLANYFTLYLPDLPGYGNSELKGAEMSIALLADAIEAIIEKEKPKELIVAGHSMGGYVLCELLHRKNRAIAKGIMIHSHPFADDAGKISSRKKANAFVKKHGGKLYVKELYKNLFASSNIPKESEIVDRFKHIFSDLKDNTIIQSNNAMINRPDRIGAIAKSKIPIQFIIGKEDSVIDLNTSLKQCYLPDVSNVQIFKKGGHLSLIEETELLAEKIIAFAKE